MHYYDYSWFKSYSAHHSFINSLEKCNGSCNTANVLATKISVQTKTKDINVKVFNMIRRINGVKALIKPISCNWKCKFDSKTCNSIRNGKRQMSMWV